MHVEAEVGRDTCDGEEVRFHTGKASKLEATCKPQPLSQKPEWDAKVKGTLELRQIAVMTGVDTLKAGTVDLDLNGHNCLDDSSGGAEASEVLAATSSEGDEAEYEGSAARSGLCGGVSAGGVGKDL